MARYTGPVCRKCRREGKKLFLKGDRCYSNKCAVDRRQSVPGMHGVSRRKTSEYGLQLRAKQTAKRYYGVLESQFSKYFGMAERQPGMTGENLLKILESRLDNVVYRSGFAASRAEARQLVRHAHYTLNGKKVDIPSILVKTGDVIAVASNMSDSDKIKTVVEANASRPVPKWLDCDKAKLTTKILAAPERDDIDMDIEEQLIVELYSK